MNVGTAPTRLDVLSDTDSAAGQTVTYYNAGAATVYVGGEDVTVASGVPLPAGVWAEEALPPGSASYGVVAEGACEVRVKQVGV